MVESEAAPVRDLSKNCAAAVRVIRKATDAASSAAAVGKKRQLFESSQVLLTIALASTKTAPSSAASSSVLLTLPHPLYSTVTDSGCLITKDLVRKPEDYEATGAHFTELLRLSGCQEGVTVLPLRELTVAYMPFEAKRRLCQSYDYFLADRRVAHRLGNKLGSHFVAKNRRKLPLPVDLEARDLAGELWRARRTARVCLGQGSTASCLVGHADQLSDEQLLENVNSACSQLFKRLPDASVVGLYLRHPACGNVPIYVAKGPTVPAAMEQPVVEEPKKAKKALRDLDKDLAELGATLWDKELLPRPPAAKLKQQKKKQKKKQKRASFGKPGAKGAKAVGATIAAKGRRRKQAE